ncbi:MAG: NfeD family protein [Bacteroidales bacterium]|nr:NfeD family protein [Bacteroidales bacterium]
MSLIITLIVIGLLLLAIEVLIIPGFGVAGILGLISLAGAAVLGFSMFNTATGLIILAVIILSTAISTWMILRSNTWKRATLNEKISSRVDTNPEEKGIGPGAQGITTSRLAPSGKARVAGKDVEVISREGIISSGSEIEVISVDDGKIVVRKSTK